MWSVCWISAVWAGSTPILLSFSCWDSGAHIMIIPKLESSWNRWFWQICLAGCLETTPKAALLSPPHEPTVTLVTDAFLARWGASVSVTGDCLQVSGKWPPSYSGHSINWSSWLSKSLLGIYTGSCSWFCQTTQWWCLIWPCKGEGSFSSALQPSMADLSISLEFRPQDSGSPYFREMQCPHGISVLEVSCPDEVGSGWVLVPGQHLALMLCQSLGTCSGQHMPFPLWCWCITWSWRSGAWT